ncbi:MAG: hypothetical protein MZV64_06535 [Ignavibacteriales bacterium]|nr:hypothetical protein [Ignavibacteriales bacterium]
MPGAFSQYNFLLLLSSCVEEKVSPKEINTITTNSDEAFKNCSTGRDMYDNLENSSGGLDLFDKAIALDKDFAMAYLYRANSVWWL